MMVSTKGRYALRVMIDLAEHDDGRFIPLKEIAARQGISEKYLESIVKLLARSGDLFGMRIVGSTEADIMKNKISDESPVGMALKGARVGEEVTVEAPDGEFKYRILDIKRAI